MAPNDELLRFPKQVAAVGPELPEEIDALLSCSVEALSSISHLHIVAAEAQDDPKAMIRVHARMAGSASRSQTERNVRAAWRNSVVGGRTSLHVVRKTERGFELVFTILERGLQVTGLYIVDFDAPE